MDLRAKPERALEDIVTLALAPHFGHDGVSGDDNCYRCRGEQALLELVSRSKAGYGRRDITIPSYWVGRAAAALDLAVQCCGHALSEDIDKVERACDMLAARLVIAGR